MEAGYCEPTRGMRSVRALRYCMPRKSNYLSKGSLRYQPYVDHRETTRIINGTPRQRNESPNERSSTDELRRLLYANIFTRAPRKGNYCYTHYRYPFRHCVAGCVHSICKLFLGTFVSYRARSSRFDRTPIGRTQCAGGRSSHHTQGFSIVVVYPSKSQANLGNLH
jgi:hypothetical protein